MEYIIKGEDVTLHVKLVDKFKNPQDITNKTVTIKTKINGVLTTFSSPDIVKTYPVYGEFTIYLSDTVTESLSVGSFDFDVYLDEGTDRKIVEIYEKAEVIDRLR